VTVPEPYFAPVSIGGLFYDLGHLDPVRFQVASEKLHRAVTVRCRFTNHVFTRGFDDQVDNASTPVIMDGIRQRVFCADRYKLSLYLPAVILELREPRIYVRETKAQRNWLYVATIDLPGSILDGGIVASQSEITRYQVFFTIRKAKRTQTVREDVEMVVESAYAEDSTRPPELLGRALLAGLATAAVEGRQVHTTRKKR
jgi:hypothetical protein